MEAASGSLFCFVNTNEITKMLFSFFPNYHSLSILNTVFSFFFNKHINIIYMLFYTIARQKVTLNGLYNTDNNMGEPMCPPILLSGLVMLSEGLAMN